MSINVSLNKNSKIRVSTNTVSSTRIVNLEDLLNVAEEINGLEDGYTLVYDSLLQKWNTKPASILNNIDGGTF